MAGSEANEVLDNLDGAMNDLNAAYQQVLAEGEISRATAKLFEKLGMTLDLVQKALQISLEDK